MLSSGCFLLPHAELRVAPARNNVRRRDQDVHRHRHNVTSTNFNSALLPVGASVALAVHQNRRRWGLRAGLLKRWAHRRPVCSCYAYQAGGSAVENSAEEYSAQEDKDMTYGVFYPPEGSEPTAVLHFCGGVFASVAPVLFYKTFLESLAKEACAIVVATPYKTDLSHDVASREAEAMFDKALYELECNGSFGASQLPVIGVGHSLGAVISVLIAARRPRAGSVFISFNQLALSQAIPVPLPPPPSDDQRGIADMLKAGAVEALDQERLLSSLQAVDEVVQAASRELESVGVPKALTPGEFAPLLSQVGPILGDLALGVSSFTPDKPEIASRLRASYGSPRTLLVQFGNDAIDETAWLRESLQVAGSDSTEPEGTTEFSIEVVRSPGGHLAPLDLARWSLGAGGPARPAQHEERIRDLAAVVGRFVRDEPVPAGSDDASDDVTMKRTELKTKLLRLCAGTNRGFESTSTERRTEIMTCFEDLEALISLDELVEGKSGIPKNLFGNWRLIWATSPDVLLLSALPLTDCGEIRQDIPKQEIKPGKPLELFNSVELSPAGTGLLGFLPPLAGVLGVKATVKALAEPREGGKLSIRFVGGTLDSLMEGMPSLPLPTLPSFQATSSVSSTANLLTTYLDGELRFARSPLGDVFVLMRVEG